MATPHHSGLSHYHYLAIGLLILNFWYSGVLLVATISDYVTWTWLVFLCISIISLPLAVISINGVHWILRLKPSQSHRVVITITLAVTLLHGLALLIVPDWYTVSGQELIFAGSWLGFFSVVVLLVSCWHLSAK